VVVAAHSSTTTVFKADTYPCQVYPLPGYVSGETNTAPVEEVAPVMVTVVEAHAPIFVGAVIEDPVCAPPVTLRVAAEIFAVLVVFPSAEKENVAAVLIAGAPSERMKVVAEPLTADVPTCPVGLAPLLPAGHAVIQFAPLIQYAAAVDDPATARAKDELSIPIPTFPPKNDLAASSP